MKCYYKGLLFFILVLKRGFPRPKKASGVKISVRDELLNKVENEKLKNVINEIYRKGASVGDGGLADAVRHELATGGN
ncbi:hypothetical protein HBP72_04755 [Listeria welshimeri]|nr:hypothetical protein [Listeria welshimeri]